MPGGRWRPTGDCSWPWVGLTLHCLTVAGRPSFQQDQVSVRPVPEAAHPSPVVSPDQFPCPPAPACCPPLCRPCLAGCEHAPFLGAQGQSSRGPSWAVGCFFLLTSAGG